MVLAAGDQRTTCATSSLSTSCGASASMCTVILTASNPIRQGATPATPHAPVKSKSASRSRCNVLIGMERATALAWMPTDKQEPSAANKASEGVGAASSLPGPIRSSIA